MNLIPGDPLVASPCILMVHIINYGAFQSLNYLGEYVSLRERLRLTAKVVEMMLPSPDVTLQ